MLTYEENKRYYKGVCEKFSNCISVLGYDFLIEKYGAYKTAELIIIFNAWNK